MVSVLRNPDFSCGATEASPYRFEESKTLSSDVKFDYVVGKDSAKVIVYPSGSPVKYLKLRFEGDFSAVRSVYGDNWERNGAERTFEWRSVVPHRELPWFCYVQYKGSVSCYGVKTGADCFASFYVDSHGITLFLNLLSASSGTDLKAPLTACEVVELHGEPGESVYSVAKRFAKMTCDKPVLPSQPIYGVNNWYWAYGKISRESVLHETDYLMQMCDGAQSRPYMIIDDGWEINRTYGVGAYLGGPWLPNQHFGCMAETAAQISQKGAIPGIWFRPLMTLGDVAEEAKMYSPGSGGAVLDPTHPYTLERVEQDTATIRSWGYKLIKHDWTTIDIFKGDNPDKILRGVGKFYDNTVTTATAIKNLYKAIQKGAGDADVIGCNTISHLTAGIHSVYRVGGDSSGRNYEWTKRNAVNSMMRLPLNNAYYMVDPDCAAFTDRVDFDVNLDFLEMCAITGVTTLASVTPGSLSDEQMKRINQIFRLASKGGDNYEIADYDVCSLPERFVSCGKQDKQFDWCKEYRGSRIILDWMN